MVNYFFFYLPGYYMYMSDGFKIIRIIFVWAKGYIWNDQEPAKSYNRRNDVASVLRILIFFFIFIIIIHFIVLFFLLYPSYSSLHLFLFHHNASVFNPTYIFSPPSTYSPSRFELEIARGRKMHNVLCNLRGLERTVFHFFPRLSLIPVYLINNTQMIFYIHNKWDWAYWK